MRSVRALMEGIIDYAGLFPPAKLDVAPAAAEYATHRAGPHRWMLSRFVCPVARLASLRDAAMALPTPPMPAEGDAADGDADAAEGPWRISAICGAEDLQEDLDAIFELEDETAGAFIVDMIERKVAAPSDIDAALDVLPDNIVPYFEFDVSGDIRGLVASLSGTEAGAKIRTGGVTADLFPSIADVARFIKTCSQADVPFKATAGLHHPLRHFAPSVETKMHGFINVFVAAFLARQLETDAIEALLAEESIEAFSFDDAGLSWGAHHVPVERIEDGRRRRAVSYGSCSFDEPLEDLQGLGLL
jgi:hypothetical protein